MKYLVTGGCGFIGSHIVDKLLTLENTESVIVIDDLSAKENEDFYYNEQALYKKLDISTDDCFHLFDNVNIVFHLAARSRIQPTLKSPGECFKVNVVGTQRVLEWSKRAGVERIIYSGTSSLYGHQNKVPFDPNMPADCLNPYSMSKWMGEQVCKLYGQVFDVPSIVLRYFNVYGPREPIKGQYAPVIGLFKRQRSNREPITIVGNGEQKRDFTYIDDVVRANILSIDCDISSNFEIYNVGTGINFSINELATMIGGPRKNIPARPAEVRETLADIEKTKKDLGWTPEFDLTDMIKSY